MHSSNSRYLKLSRRLFIFLIVILGITACISAPSYDKNTLSKSTKRPSTHKVVSGDTLFSIAWRYGFKYQDLAKYNNISTSYRIYPGQIIRLPGSIVAASASGRSTKSNDYAPKSSVKAYSKNTRSKYQTNTISKSTKPVLQAGAIIWLWPSKGAILQHFSGATTLNKGIDIGGKLGEPVLAAASGQVVYAGNGLRGYGKLLIIRHNDTFLSAYAHNNRLLVKEGDFVKAGQRIADMGSSGTDGVKLHFEIRRDGTPENPLTYLPKP